MRENAVNKTVADRDLWKEWKPHGIPNFVDTSGNCLCGHGIKWEHQLINIINGIIIGPIGNVCILNAQWERFECDKCRRKFKDIPRNAIERRIKEYDWVCTQCDKAAVRKFGHVLGNEFYIHALFGKHDHHLTNWELECKEYIIRKKKQPPPEIVEVAKWYRHPEYYEAEIIALFSKPESDLTFRQLCCKGYLKRRGIVVEDEVPSA
jgi:hypothetical protein